MEIETYIKKIKNVYSELMKFIESEDSDKILQKLDSFLHTQVNFQNKGEIRLLFQLITTIAKNHNQTEYFFDNLSQVIQLLLKKSDSSISDFIDDITKFNRRLLFNLLDKKYIKPDKKLIDNYKSNKYFVQYYHYLYPVMRQFLDKNTCDQLEKSIISKYDMSIDTFTEKCRANGNDSYICLLIREDSIDDFIIYLNKTNISLSSTINPSFFETNQFLIDKYPTLIEYAAFYGSMRVIQYLHINKVELNYSIWEYAVHSKNEELIYFLIDNGISLNQEFFFERSIKCHHNDITDYIRNEILNDDKSDYDFFNTFFLSITSSYNLYYYPNEVTNLFSNISMSNFFNELVILSQTTTLTIPSSVTLISPYLFRNAISLKSVTFLSPSSLTKIGNNSFEGCSSLEEILIPSSIIFIGREAFKNCTSLKKVQFYENIDLDGHQSLEKASIYSYSNVIDDSAFDGCSSLEQFSIPSSIINIYDNVFNGCSKLNHVSIPNSVICIRNYVFNDCSSLEKISIPYSVKYIGENICKGCLSLKEISIPYSLDVKSFALSPNTKIIRI